MKLFLVLVIFLVAAAVGYGIIYYPKPALSKGYIECYLSSGDLYFSDIWVGRMRIDDNVFIFKSEFKDIEVKVSGPCVSQEE